MQKECKNWDWNEKSASFDILYKVIGEAWEEERKWENKNEIENSEWKHEDVKEKKKEGISKRKLSRKGNHMEQEKNKRKFGQYQNGRLQVQKETEK